MALLLLGAIRGERDGANVLTPLAALTMLVAALVAVSRHDQRTLAFDGHFVFDSFAAFMKVLILARRDRAHLLLAGQFLRDEKIERYEYPLLVLFSALGMCMMVSANSLLALYMAIELQSLPIYVLAAVHRDNLRATEAGLKYFVLGALASGMLLYGCSLVYGFAGTHQLRPSLPTRWTGGTALPLGALVGLVFVVSGLAFKMAAVPFHMWTPDVYEGSPSPVTAFMAGAPKVAAVGLMVRVLHGSVRRLDRAVAAGGGRARAGLDGAGSVRGDRPDQHQAADGLQRHRQCRLRAGRRRGRHRRAASTRPWST